MRLVIPFSVSLLAAKTAEANTMQFNPIESIFNGPFAKFSSTMPAANVTSRGIPDPHAPTFHQREAERMARRERMRARNEKMKETIQNLRPDTIERVSQEELEAMKGEHPSLRKLAWNDWMNSDKNMINYADPGDDYDMWQQAYRMLGGFIDCDHQKDNEGSHDNGEENNNNNNEENGQACSRWMLWASYVDPNYKGNGYYEYFGDTPTGNLDCHKPDTEWILLGVYRQEFYQFIEQISKHLWAIDEYEYVVALAGLAYMTDDDCFYVGQTSNGEDIYAGVAPLEYGRFEMALYTDGYCLTPNDNTGYSFDDFGLYSDVKLQSGDGDDGGGGDYSYATEWWQDTQEYTLTQLNDVYEDFKYCTSCIDYPTYQDGYYIGDTGTDEDDLINQCWKFYSHDSFPCESDCIALASAQGTVLSVVAGGKMYGQAMSSFYQESNVQTGSGSGSESQFSRLLSNVFVTFSFIVFVATFLAFAVARRSRYRESRSSRSRRLLDDDRSPRSKRAASRSKSKTRSGDGDGLFRSSSSGRKRSKSKTRSRSRGKEDYDPPKSSRRNRSRSRNDDR